MIKVQRNGEVFRSGDRNPAACKSIVENSSLFTRVISIAIRCTVFQLKAFVIVGQ